MLSSWNLKFKVHEWLWVRNTNLFQIVFVCYGTGPMTNTLFLLFTRAKPSQTRIFPVLICRGATSVTKQTNISGYIKYKKRCKYEENRFRGPRNPLFSVSSRPLIGLRVFYVSRWSGKHRSRSPAVRHRPARRRVATVLGDWDPETLASPRPSFACDPSPLAAPAAPGQDDAFTDRLYIRTTVVRPHLKVNQQCNTKQCDALFLGI